LTNVVRIELRLSQVQPPAGLLLERVFQYGVRHVAENEPCLAGKAGVDGCERARRVQSDRQAAAREQFVAGG